MRVCVMHDARLGYTNSLNPSRLYLSDIFWPSHPILFPKWWKCLEKWDLWNSLFGLSLFSETTFTLRTHWAILFLLPCSVC